ncbi:MAG TPA: hypothetical protein VLV48_09565 [Thermoanaerobaculia bacterium]|nr:hypothetical protein [Thermoanaerobaculia bacterium]
MTENDIPCPECGTPGKLPNHVCSACGAPPSSLAGSSLSPADADANRRDNSGIRTTDLEPYVTLRYIAKLFKVLAALMVLMLIGEVTTGLITHGTGSIVTLVGEATRFLVLAGLLWAAGDLAVLGIDLGHDIRVSRILLGRINAELHRKAQESEANGERR